MKKHRGIQEIRKSITRILSGQVKHVPYTKRSDIIKPNEIKNYIKRSYGNQSNRKITDKSGS